MKKTFQAKRWNRLWTRGGLAFFLGLLMLLAVALLSAGPDTPSELARFAGRFHPLLVHLPIGFLIVAFLLECFSLSPRFSYLQPAVVFILILCAVSAVMAAGAGLLLAQEGGYDDALLYWHKRLGIAVAVAVVLACILKAVGLRRTSVHVRRAYAFVLAGSVGLLAAAGHLGGSLTHGSDYLTYYLPGPLRSLAGLSPRAAAHARFDNIEEVVVYRDLIQPIFESRCVACHNAGKRRGRLQLDTPEGLREGGEDGPVLVAGRAHESELVRRILLPPGHEDVMPPEGKAPLTPAQAELIRWWIDEGAHFDRTVAQTAVPHTVRPILDWLSVPREQQGVLALEVPPADPGAVEKLRVLGLQVMPLSGETSLLQVQPAGAPDRFGDEEAQALLPLAQQITWLDLGGTRIGDAGLAVLGQLENLTRLHLEQTRVGDAGLARLKGLAHLEYLNLYGTEVSDDGLVHLAALSNLRSLYLWQTDVTEEGARRLQQEVPGLDVNLGWKPEPVAAESTRVAAASYE